MHYGFIIGGGYKLSDKFLNHDKKAINSGNHMSINSQAIKEMYEEMQETKASFKKELQEMKSQFEAEMQEMKAYFKEEIENLKKGEV